MISLGQRAGLDKGALPPEPPFTRVSLLSSPKTTRKHQKYHLQTFFFGVLLDFSLIFGVFSADPQDQDKFDHDKGQKSAISGRRLHWRLSTGFFAFSPVF